MKISEPTKLTLPTLKGPHLDALRESLTYVDQKAEYAYREMKKSGGWFASKYGQEAYEEKLKELKAETRICLLQEDATGFWTYSGLRNYLSKKLDTQVQNDVKYPAPKLLAWSQVPEHKMYPYQEAALEKLLEAKHAGVEMGTGLGKSFIIANLIKRLGLKTLVMTPATQISEQLFSGEDGKGGLRQMFGRSKVGAFFDGKKDLSKLITVANAQSLTRIEEGTEIWKQLQEVDVFIADESHQCPAQTLAKVCFGAAAHAPYRFFFSATQMRGDGLGMLLDAITGPIVYEMTVRQGVDQKYLAKPIFRVFETTATDNYRSYDANEMTRRHLFYNPKIAAAVGNMANMAVSAGMPVLVLIEEVEQFTKLLPYLKFPVGFAHGPLSDDKVENGRIKAHGNKKKIPKEFWDSDPSELVRQFNAGKLPILVGTSCISTGTDVRVVKFLVYWQGGKSEIQVKQAVGRGTRKTPDKISCHVVDFDVTDVQVLHRHTQARKKLYDELYGPVRELSL
jgi:superfamily II DNA or RNA helicase